MDKNTALLAESNSKAVLKQKNPKNVTGGVNKHVYVDAQSSGLTSRIVEYHDHGKHLNHRMYSKAGQFPVVYLKKTELPYKATKQPLSMTHIAPPTKKSVFYGNTLSSLLRSNSVLGLKNTDEVAHENRPILHPPPSEDDLAPTRSVLDVLKEISRKRINSDELDHNDSKKKYCSHSKSCSVFDGRARDIPGETQIPGNYKRQREQANYNALPAESTTTITSKHLPFAKMQLSPQQCSKKRQCSYNNDISSSLSSSVHNLNKRKFSEQLTNVYAKKVHSVRLVYEGTPQLMPEFELSETSIANVSKVVPGNTTTAIVKTSVCDDAYPTHSATDLTPPAATNGVPLIDFAKQCVKPKVTLFDKKYDIAIVETAPQLQKRLCSAVDAGEYLDIQFVRPKNAFINANKNPLIERTQKSKLALMLCGLRGDLEDSGAEDYIHSGPAQSDGDRNVTSNSSTTAGTEITDSTTATTLDSNMLIAVASLVQEKVDTVSATIAATIPSTNVTSPTASMTPSISSSSSTITQGVNIAAVTPSFHASLPVAIASVNTTFPPVVAIANIDGFNFGTFGTSSAISPLSSSGTAATSTASNNVTSTFRFGTTPAASTSTTAAVISSGDQTRRSAIPVADRKASLPPAFYAPDSNISTTDKNDNTALPLKGAFKFGNSATTPGTAFVFGGGTLAMAEKPAADPTFGAGSSAPICIGGGDDVFRGETSTGKTPLFFEPTLAKSNNNVATLFADNNETTAITQQHRQHDESIIFESTASTTNNKTTHFTFGAKVESKSPIMGGVGNALTATSTPVVSCFSNGAAPLISFGAACNQSVNNTIACTNVESAKSLFANTSYSSNHISASNGSGFGSVANNNTNNQIKSTFKFGSGSINNNNVMTSGGSFSFGGIEVPKNFAFGDQTSMVATAPMGSTKQFIFSEGSTAANMFGNLMAPVTMPGGGNMFAQPGDRVIRKATRRLQKS